MVLRDRFTNAVCDVICRYMRGNRIPLSEVLLRFNRLVFSGEYVCTCWGSIAGIPYCASIVYVLEELETEGIIRIDRENGWIEIPKPEELCGVVEGG